MDVVHFQGRDDIGLTLLGDGQFEVIGDFFRTNNNLVTVNLADNDWHSLDARKLARKQAAVAGHHLIAARLAGNDHSGLLNAEFLHTVYELPHSIIVLGIE